MDILIIDIKTKEYPFMNRLETLIPSYMKNCEPFKKMNKKTLKAYRIDLAQFQTFMLAYPDFESVSDYVCKFSGLP